MRKLIHVLIMTSALLSTSISAAGREQKQMPSEILGAVIPAENSVASAKKLEVIDHLFTWLDAVGSKKVALNRVDVNSYFDANINYSVNNKVLAKGEAAFLERCKQLITYHESMHVTLPLDKVLVAGNSAAVFYQLAIHNKNGDYIDHVAAFITFKNDKVISWKAVAVHG